MLLFIKFDIKKVLTYEEIVKKYLYKNKLNIYNNSTFDYYIEWIPFLGNNYILNVS